tara:strand:- start:902 stop:1087 length:186 start_codon:yes stop_codon:yes gene_type:complete
MTTLLSIKLIQFLEFLYRFFEKAFLEDGCFAERKRAGESVPERTSPMGYNRVDDDPLAMEV